MARVRQTACRHCGQDIENFAPYKIGEWRDRGNNTHCPDKLGDAGRRHVPVANNPHETRFNTNMTSYHDGGDYLELHALRAPVGGYTTEDPDEYDMAIQVAIEQFEHEHDVQILQLGRSGRHICIEDTPRNRRRYASLQRKAIQAARDVWDSLRSADFSQQD